MTAAPERLGKQKHKW